MLVCAATIFIGFGSSMTKEDVSVYKTASQNCSKYYPDAPCLKKLIKKEEQVYHAVCGAKDKPKE